MKTKFAILVGMMSLLGAARGYAQTPACTDLRVLESTRLTDGAATLIRALSSTKYLPGLSTQVARNAVRSQQFCADSLPFLRDYSQPVAPPRIVQAAAAETQVIHNSAYPRSMNDGALWSGKGWNQEVTAGVAGRWRFLRYAATPAVTYQQNADHVFAQGVYVGYSEYANAYHGFEIDLPNRHGGESFSDVSAGNSFIAAEAGPVEVAFSNENLWLGPAQNYALLLSNTAPGFPHVRFGTPRPVNLKFINAEINVFWGSLTESEFFDGGSANDNRLFTGTEIMIEPAFLRGLYIGFARTYHDSLSATGQDIGFYLSHLVESPLFVDGGNRPGNAIGALYWRWIHPAAGFEAYGEWTREDTPYNAEDILREPDWTQAWMVGLQKVIISQRRLTRVYAEFVHLGASAATARTARGPFTTYTHSTVRQGHTNRGQLLGSPSGLGSDAQHVGVDVFARTIRFGGFLERVRYDDDAYYTTFARRFGEARHDVEMSVGGHARRKFGPVEAHASLTLSRRYDRDFISLKVESEEPMRETNVQAGVAVRWRPEW